MPPTMDKDTIKKLLKLAEANLAAARAELQQIYDDPAYEDCQHDWADAIDDANAETYACEQVVRFLTAHLNNTK